MDERSGGGISFFVVDQLGGNLDLYRLSVWKVELSIVYGVFQITESIFEIHNTLVEWKVGLGLQNIEVTTIS